MRKKLLFIFGTRPEVIKMAPVILKFKQDPSYEVFVCNTGQQVELCDGAMSIFDIHPDYNLNTMHHGQTLATSLSKILTGLDSLPLPDYVFVQGDTTSAFAGALYGFYNKVKVCHIEAGLRTNDKYSPFPEEINRQAITLVSDYNFAPTEDAAKNIINAPGKVIVTGNTGIDAVNLCRSKITTSNNQSEKILLFTVHRRENFGEPLHNICYAIKKLARLPNIKIILPVHTNPSVSKIVKESLSDIENIKLLDPLDYFDFISYMDMAYMILTDSGGVTEEGCSFGKPILILRENTERPEAVVNGNALIVGTDSDIIYNTTKSILDDNSLYNKYCKSTNPFGDGLAAQRIHDYFKNNNL